MAPHIPQHPVTDPRPLQISIQALLLFAGWCWSAIPVAAMVALAFLAVPLLTQWLLTRAYRLPRFDPRSALITGLSLCLLLRTHNLWLAGLAGSLAIAGKFLIRVRGKHVFNPSNLAVVVLSLLAPGVWVSPGQWGGSLWFAGLAGFLGSLAVGRSERFDIVLAFLAVYVGGLFGRALWLGDPLAIPLHQVQSGTLLVFAFLMLSDPKATPDARAGRVVFAAAVAALALYLRFHWFVTAGPIYALAALSPLVPLIDRLLPAARFQWAAGSSFPIPTKAHP